MQKIGLSERGKPQNVENLHFEETVVTKKISALICGESSGTVPVKQR